MTTMTRTRGSARRSDGGHAHRFIMETPEAAMQRQPDVANYERTVLGACHCGATTQAKAFFGTSYGPEGEDPRDLAA